MNPAIAYLVRHGETDWNRERRWQGWSDRPLNPRGVEQAKALAARLRGLRLDALYTSGLARARQTAVILGEALGLEPVDEPGLREIGLGGLEGTDGRVSRPDIREAISAAARVDPEPLAEGAESFTTFSGRVRDAWRRIASAHAGGRVMLVSHGGTLRTLIAALIGLDPAHIDRLSLRGNTSLSVLDFRHGRPQLVRVNDTHHLGDELG